jgi:hypothetical protein
MFPIFLQGDQLANRLVPRPAIDVMSVFKAMPGIEVRPLFVITISQDEARSTHPSDDPLHRGVEPPQPGEINSF